uniref:Methyltransferase HEMK2 n=1 Tax=Ascaris lumbricoides TaxID=6252 RepID=A0A0M3IUL4_ASCLU
MTEDTGMSQVVGRTLNETMLPTPSYMISDEQRESVYEPAEDTFLLLDALEKDAEVLRDRDVSIVVEVGCGSGVVSAFCAQLLQRPACILATDVNFMALKCTKNTAILNAIDLDTVQCDLIVALSDRLRGIVDLLLFNPPYVPTCTKNTAILNAIDLDTVQCDLIVALSDRLRGIVDLLLFNPPYVPTVTTGNDNISRCWAGGASGREVIDRLLKEVPKLLSPTGLMYIIALKANNIPELLTYSSSLKGEVLLQRRCGIEYLYVLKFQRIC